MTWPYIKSLFERKITQGTAKISMKENTQLKNYIQKFIQNQTFGSILDFFNLVNCYKDNYFTFPCEYRKNVDLAEKISFQKSLAYGCILLGQTHPNRPSWNESLGCE